MQRTLRVMKATATESIELASYRLRDVAVNWYESWELSIGEDALPAVWKEFTEAFLHHYFSPELRRARVDRFLILRQGNMCVREYNLQFDSLARYASTIVAKMEDQVHRFMMGLETYLLNDCMLVSLHPGIDISHIQAYAQGVEERKQKQRADHEHDRGERPSQSSRASSSQYRGDSSQMRPPLPRCAQCGKQYDRKCLVGLGVCYTCGYPGHVMRDCPTRGGAGIVQPSRSIASSSSSVRPPGQVSQAPAGSGRGRSGASSSSSPQNHIYALAGRQDHESSPDVVTGSTLSYATLLVASKFGIEPELIEPFEMSTHVGDPVIARRVYKDCIVVVHHSIVADLIELDMVEFDVIMGEPILEWKGNTASPRGRFISYLKTRTMIRKGYNYHLVWVLDVKAESPSLQSIPVVNEFPDIFPDELSGLPPEREIEFAIDTLPDTQPISNPPYRMAPAYLRELKEQRRDLLEIGFIRPSTSPWGATVLFVRKKDGSLWMCEGIRVDTQKIEAVKTWPRPTTPTEKATKFQWTGACEQSFQALKDRLTLAPVLTLLEGTDGYAIYCDASGIGLGCVLMQHGKANVVADALNHRSIGSLSYLQPEKCGIAYEIHHLASLGVRLLDSGATKMYHDIGGTYWWDRMKKDIAELVSQCPNCQQVKIEHQKPGGLFIVGYRDSKLEMGSD
ncbi:uncharacterized protein [Nicotiana tomentosiformis]|uniref:uncharacterized protein n=1 Tax=Nicotiana tomentosiformis TaxID=4098 RepID=UPI00388CDAD2